MKQDLPKRSFDFAKRIVVLCKHLDDTPGVSRTLAKQLFRSGTSIGANIEEGQASQSEPIFSASTASPARKHGRHITGFGCCPKRILFRLTA